MAFENSLCTDYVTEKLYQSLKYNIIPVVLGGSDIQNYKKFAPPKSYINVEDFKTISELTNYIEFLSSNPNEYIKYFWWKQYYKVDVSSYEFCRLCQKLHEDKIPPTNNKYDNLYE